MTQLGETHKRSQFVLSPLTRPQAPAASSLLCLYVSLHGRRPDALRSKPKLTYCPLNLLHAGPASLRPGKRSVLLTLETKPQDTSGLAVPPLSVQPPANPTRVCCPHWSVTTTSGLGCCSDLWTGLVLLHLPAPRARGWGAQSHTPERISPKREPCHLNSGPHFPPGAELSGWCQL